jgi:hypothetical protein
MCAAASGGEEGGHTNEGAKKVDAEKYGGSGGMQRKEVSLLIA